MKYKKLISYLIALSTFVAILFLLYSLFEYPMNTGRVLLYVSLLIALILIMIDLGFNEALSRWIDKRLSYRWSLVISSIIIVVVLSTLSFWAMNYANTVLKTGNPQNRIGEMYPSDMGALYVAWVPIILYGFYYLALCIYNYITRKPSSHQLMKQT